MGSYISPLEIFLDSLGIFLDSVDCSFRKQDDTERTNIIKSQCCTPEVILNSKDFCCFIVKKYVIIRHLVGDGVVDECDKSTTASNRTVVPDGIVRELFKGRVHIEFSLLHSCDQHLVTVKEVLQFSVVVLNAVAIKMQEPAPLLRQVPLLSCSSGHGREAQWRGVSQFLFPRLSISML